MSGPGTLIPTAVGWISSTNITVFVTLAETGFLRVWGYNGAEVRSFSNQTVTGRPFKGSTKMRINGITGFLDGGSAGTGDFEPTVSGTFPGKYASIAMNWNPPRGTFSQGQSRYRPFSPVRAIDNTAGISIWTLPEIPGTNRITQDLKYNTSGTTNVRAQVWNSPTEEFFYDRPAGSLIPSYSRAPSYYVPDIGPGLDVNNYGIKFLARSNKTAAFFNCTMQAGCSRMKDFPTLGPVPFNIMFAGFKSDPSGETVIFVGPDGVVYLVSPASGWFPVATTRRINIVTPNSQILRLIPQPATFSTLPRLYMLNNGSAITQLAKVNASGDLVSLLAPPLSIFNKFVGCSVSYCLAAIQTPAAIEFRTFNRLTEVWNSFALATLFANDTQLVGWVALSTATDGLFGFAARDVGYQPKIFIVNAQSLVMDALADPTPFLCLNCSNFVSSTNSLLIGLNTTAIIRVDMSNVATAQIVSASIISPITEVEPGVVAWLSATGSQRWDLLQPSPVSTPSISSMGSPLTSKAGINLDNTLHVVNGSGWLQVLSGLGASQTEVLIQANPAASGVAFCGVVPSRLNSSADDIITVRTVSGVSTVIVTRVGPQLQDNVTLLSVAGNVACNVDKNRTYALISARREVYLYSGFGGLISVFSRTSVDDSSSYFSLDLTAPVLATDSPNGTTISWSESSLDFQRSTTRSYSVEVRSCATSSQCLYTDQTCSNAGVCSPLVAAGVLRSSEAPSLPPPTSAAPGSCGQLPSVTVAISSYSSSKCYVISTLFLDSLFRCPPALV